MTNLATILSTLLRPALPRDAGSPRPPQDRPERIDHDLIGLSDMDAIGYYESRRWRGRN